MLISIIIPIYKVEPYIIKCIDSVLNQTYRQLEVILVDDCSPDCSMAIAQEYIRQSPLSKDLKFIYLKHERNRGLSAARNTGIDAAKGEYVYFLDSDDEITPDCIEKLSQYAKVGYEIVQGEYVSSDRPYTEGTLSDIPMLSNDEILTHFIGFKGIRQNAANKLCRRSFLMKHGLFFLEGLINEDDLWTFQCYCHATSFYYYAGCTYLYNIRPNSIMTSTENKNLVKNLIKIYGLKIDYCIEKHITKDLVFQVLRNFFFWIYYWNKKDPAPLSRFYIYRQLRKNDRRTFLQKWHSYATMKSRLRYFYELLPVLLAYPFFSIKLRMALR